MKRARHHWSAAVVVVVAFAVLAWAYREANWVITPCYDPVEDHPTTQAVRRAVANRATRMNFQEYIPVPPDIDTITLEGQVAKRHMRHGLSLETAALLREASSYVEWVIHVEGDTRPHLVGIAWDRRGLPHYFRAGL